MQKFQYPWYAKVLYRWANIPLTILLIIHWGASLIAILDNWIFVFPLVINTLVIYLLNRFFLRAWKQFPFSFEMDNEKMILSDFMNKEKVIEIKHSEIDKIYGGVLTGQPTRPVYFEVTKRNLKIGLFHHVKGMSKILTIVLSNVPKELYKELLNNAKQLNDAQKAARAQRGKKKGR